MSEELVTDYMIKIQQLKQQLQLEKDNVAELNELLISYKEENEVLRHTIHEWEHDCNSKREKLEKIKEKCTSINNLLNGVTDSDYNIGRITTAQDILQIIEGDNNE